MGTGVLVDGLDFSDDKMLVGRTFSYSDTQRYRVGPNYLQLPVNQPKNARVAHQPARRADVLLRRPRAGPEPARQLRTIASTTASEAPRPEPNNPPEIRGVLTRSVIERRNDYVQARARYCTMLDWERETC